MAAVTFGFFSKHKSATRSVATEWLWSWLFLGLLASGNPSRYRYERPSRVVEIKQGRLQGTLVEVPLVSPYSSSAAGNDKNQVGHLMIIVNENELFHFKAATVKYRMCDWVCTSMYWVDLTSLLSRVTVDYFLLQSKKKSTITWQGSLQGMLVEVVLKFSDHFNRCEVVIKCR